MMKSDLFSAKCLKEFISQKMIENQQPKNMVLQGEILKRESCFRFIKLGLAPDGAHQINHSEASLDLIQHSSSDVTKQIRKMLRSTSCGQWMGRIRRILAW